MTNLVCIWLAVFEINYVREEHTRGETEDAPCQMCVGVRGTDTHCLAGVDVRRKTFSVQENM